MLRNTVNVQSSKSHVSAPHATHVPPSGGDLPPTLTKGGNATGYCLDYLTITVPFQDDIEYALLPHPGLFITGERLRSRKGYDTTLGISYGGTLSYHTHYPERRICVTLPGQSLYQMRQGNIDILEWLAYAFSMEGRITRMDVALDYFGPADHLALYTAWHMGELKTAARTVELFRHNKRQHGSIEQTDTVYIGSKSSETRVRCYDKAAQRNWSKPCIRVELVTQKKAATRLARAMVKHGLEQAGKQALRNFVDCDLPWFRTLTQGESVPIEPSSRRETNTRRWLLQDVLPSFHRELEAERDEKRDELLQAYLYVILEGKLPGNL